MTPSPASPFETRYTEIADACGRYASYRLRLMGFTPDEQVVDEAAQVMVMRLWEQADRGTIETSGGPLLERSPSFIAKWLWARCWRQILRLNNAAHLCVDLAELTTVPARPQPGTIIDFLAAVARKAIGEASPEAMAVLCGYTLKETVAAGLSERKFRHAYKTLKAAA
jgi:hypothetical protein